MNIFSVGIITKNLIENRLFSLPQDQQTVTEADAVSLITPNKKYA